MLHIQHDRYKLTTTTIYNDIALLILKEDLNLSTPEVQPVPRLADRRLDYIATCTRNENCVTVGYGVYNQSDIDSQDPVVSPTGEIQGKYRSDFLRIVTLIAVIFFAILVRVNYFRIILPSR